MVDQVTFPPSIGGSGNTYTNDANPETGMYGGAHRKNFFPIQADMVAAAGYVSQYAQAIDGAKANADRAEDAKGYVEAVADAYKVNILEPHKRKATLGLDFIEGRYWKDDGERIEANDPGQIATIIRSGPRNEIGPNGVMRETPPNAIARAWRQGKAQGVQISETMSNRFLYSEDFTNAAWLTGSSDQIVPNAMFSPRGDLTADRLESVVSGTSIRYVGQSVSTDLERYTVCGFVKPDQVEWFRVRSTEGESSYFNARTLDKNEASGMKITMFRLRSGWVHFFVEFDGSGTNETIYIYLHHNYYGVNSIMQIGDGAYIWGFGLFKGVGYRPYVKTEGSPVTSSGEAVAVENVSKIISHEEFSVFQEVRLDSFFESIDYLFFMNNAVGTTTPWFGLGWNNGLLRLRSSLAESNNILPALSIELGYHKIGVSVSKNNFILSVDGVSYSGESEPLTPDVLGLFKLGFSSFDAGVRHTAAHAQTLVMPYALTAAELDKVTAL